MQPDGFIEIIEEGAEANQYLKYFTPLIDSRYHIPRTPTVVHRAAQGKRPIQ
jgi:hypothetical protein